MYLTLFSISASLHTIVTLSSMKFKESESESHSVVSNFLQPHGLSPWNSPGQNTRVGSLPLLQGIFPTQGLNPGLLHRRQIFYRLSYKGSPFIKPTVRLTDGVPPFNVPLRKKSSQTLTCHQLQDEPQIQ